MSNFIKNRPLSPHLQIYKLIPTMLMSIMHRITGGILYFGMILVSLWFLSLATGSGAFELFRFYADYMLFKVVFFAYSWAVIHHMLGGIRHLVWDLGFCFEKHLSTRLAKIHIVSSSVIVMVIWMVRAFFIRNEIW
ncbi:succinate dehydrogenase, cytochrome b556 subunit [Candidatus Liberibacter sp.]|uniref:succinate dehydrogenase, cytochrome b556 subunit n=1 Tax=Candidatus Liberibacter sp. TaxID=34022 RepID=UPI0015F654CC|nr:succinate dehydrogenase, cytochrome b556 subunit [Candidatus Liberibacter sp.]MBA5724163.1 succinate dehydrogenase, cytochrome b556 subunit [Candidatus Liberibacter sp.]